jgi:hypothetical protein
MVHRIFFVVALLVCNVANATSTFEIENWIKKGAQLRREGDHVGALEAFLRAHALSASGRTWAQIGLARQSLHQWSESETCLKTALEGKEPWVEKNRGLLESALEDVKGHVGWLLVKGTDGVRLSINETVMGPLPMKEIRLDEGRHIVKGEQEGFVPWMQTIEVVGGKTKEVLVMLERNSSANRVGTRPGLVLSTSRRPGRDRTLSMVGASVFGAGLAVATVGTVIWIQQESGDFGHFNTGVTGPILVVGGVAGMAVGSAVVYADREKTVAVGMSAMGPVVKGSF